MARAHATGTSETSPSTLPGSPQPMAAAIANDSPGHPSVETTGRAQAQTPAAAGGDRTSVPGGLIPTIQQGASTRYPIS